jgi:LPXTG-motif cell wall-anchored protein
VEGEAEVPPMATICHVGAICRGSAPQPRETMTTTLLTIGAALLVTALVLQRRKEK